MYANTTSNILFLLSILIILIHFSKYVESAKHKGKLTSCDKNGKCKYGGHCDLKTNTCLCNFRCSSSLWDTSLYCGPKKPGQKAIFFKNICQVVAYACENQEEVPIIKYVPSNKNRRTTPKKFCRAARRKSEEILCPRPEDFKGLCGGNSGPQGNINAGICLMTKLTGQKSCVCPASKRGENCQEKDIKMRSISEPEIDDKTVGKMNGLDLDKVAVFAAMSTIAFLLVIAVFVKRRKTNNDSEDVVEEQQTSGNMKDTCVKITENNNLTTTTVTADAVKQQDSNCLFSKKTLSTKLPGKVIPDVKHLDKINKTKQVNINERKKASADFN